MKQRVAAVGSLVVTMIWREVSVSDTASAPVSNDMMSRSSGFSFTGVLQGKGWNGRRQARLACPRVTAPATALGVQLHLTPLSRRPLLHRTVVGERGADEADRHRRGLALLALRVLADRADEAHGGRRGARRRRGLRRRCVARGV